MERQMKIKMLSTMFVQKPNEDDHIFYVHLCSVHRKMSTKEQRMIDE
jgi:hypothetical protein